MTRAATTGLTAQRAADYRRAAADVAVRVRRLEEADAELIASRSRAPVPEAALADLVDAHRRLTQLIAAKLLDPRFSTSSP